MRTQKALRNLSTYAIYEILAFLNNIIVGRLVLSMYGSDYNGLLNSVIQITSLFAVIRSGIFGTARAQLFAPLSTGDVDGISGIVNACSTVMKKITGLLLVFILGLSLTYPFLVKSELPRIDITVVILIIGFSTLSQYCFGFTYQILLNADQSIYIYTSIQIVAIIVTSVVSYILIILGNSFIVMKSLTCIFTIITPIILSIIVKRRYRINTSVPPNSSVIKQKKYAMSHAIADIVNKRTDIVIITILMTLKDVSIYSVYFIIINAVQQVFNSLCDTFSSAFGSMLAEKEETKFCNYFALYEYLTQMFIIVVFSSVSTLLCSFVMIYSKGVGDVNYFLPVFAMLASITGAMNCIRLPYYTAVVMSGHYKQTQVGAILEPIVNILISIVLVKFIGINGVLLGSILAGGIRSFQLMIYSSKNITKTNVIKTIFWNIATLGICTLATVMQTVCLRKMKIDNYKQLITAGISCVIISIIVCLAYSVICKRNEFRFGLQYFKRVFTKNSEIHTSSLK